MRYDHKKLLELLEGISPMLYAASDESVEAYDGAIGEVDAWLEGHKMHYQEQVAEMEESGDL